jgi:hypothetical protein
MIITDAALNAAKFVYRDEFWNLWAIPELPAGTRAEHLRILRPRRGWLWLGNEDWRGTLQPHEVLAVQGFLSYHAKEIPVDAGSIRRIR